MTKLLSKIVCFLLMLTVLGGCGSVKVTEFEKTKPVLKPEEFFLGDTEGTGMFTDLFGRVRSRFTMKIKGYWKDDTFVMEEALTYDDGKKENRIWNLKKIDEHNYDATTSDVVGTAKVQAYGNVNLWRYYFNVKTKEGVMKLWFDDWMYLQPNGLLIDRAYAYKWGINVGELLIAISKVENSEKE